MYTYHANPDYRGHWGIKGLEEAIANEHGIDRNILLSNGKRPYENYVTPQVGFGREYTRVTPLTPFSGEATIRVEKANVVEASTPYGEKVNISGPELFRWLSVMHDPRLEDGWLTFQTPNGVELSVEFDDFAVSLRGNPGVTKEELQTIWDTSQSISDDTGAFIGQPPTHLDIFVWEQQIQDKVAINRW